MAERRERITAPIQRDIPVGGVFGTRTLWPNIELHLKGWFTLLTPNDCIYPELKGVAPGWSATFGGLLPTFGPTGRIDWDSWMEENGHCSFRFLTGQEQRDRIDDAEQLRAHFVSCDPPRLRGDECFLNKSDLSVVEQSIVFSGEPFEPCPGQSADDHESMVREAIALLMKNWDIIEWIACLLDERFPECLHKHFFKEGPGEGKRVFLSLDVNTRKPNFAYTVDADPNCSVEFQNAFCTNYIQPFLAGDISRACAVVFISGTILHEFLHCCGLETAWYGNAKHKSDGCSVHFMIKRAWLWAISQRYPGLLEEDGCFSIGSDFSDFMSSKQISPTV